MREGMKFDSSGEDIQNNRAGEIRLVGEHQLKDRILILREEIKMSTGKLFQIYLSCNETDLTKIISYIKKELNISDPRTYQFNIFENNDRKSTHQLEDFIKEIDNGNKQKKLVIIFGFEKVIEKIADGEYVLTRYGHDYNQDLFDELDTKLTNPILLVSYINPNIQTNIYKSAMQTAVSSSFQNGVWEVK